MSKRVCVRPCVRVCSAHERALLFRGTEKILAYHRDVTTECMYEVCQVKRSFFNLRKSIIESIIVIKLIKYKNVKIRNL